MKPPRRKDGRREPYPLRAMRLLLLCAVLLADGPRRAVSRALSEQERLQSESEANMRQAEATIGAVQKDMTALATFGDEVRRSLAEESRAKDDVAHAIGYFRRQIELQSGERDIAAAHIARLEGEVRASCRTGSRTTLRDDSGCARHQEALRRIQAHAPRCTGDLTAAPGL